MPEWIKHMSIHELECKALRARILLSSNFLNCILFAAISD